MGWSRDKNDKSKITSVFVAEQSRGPRERSDSAQKSRLATVYQNKMKGKSAMKKTVKGKVYDTKTAKVCCSCDLSIDFIDEFRYMTETLYKTPEGDFSSVATVNPVGSFSARK